MGRSVHVPSDAEAVLYLDWTPRPEDHVWYDEDENEVPYTEDDIGTTEWAFLVDDEWDYLIEDLQYNVLGDLFPSVQPADYWITREGHVVAENAHVMFGVSEYCGLASVWAVLKESSYGPDPKGLARHWLRQAWPLIEDRYPHRLERMAYFSSGEAVYQKVTA